MINHERQEHGTRLNINITDDDKIIKINNLLIPSARTTHCGLTQLKVNGPRIWNALPTEIKNLTSLKVSLKELKIHYISEYS